MPTRTTPEDGDIGVREETREGTLVYVLHTAPSSEQYVLRSRKEAVAQAVRFAKRERVRAWLADEGYDFALLVDFRVAESAKRKTDDTVRTAADRSSKARPNRAAQLTDSDVACRAYYLYLARGREHDHHVDDWLRAERELENAASPTVA